eukprot:2228482-Rhodomonas_salina.1
MPSCPRHHEAVNVSPDTPPSYAQARTSSALRFTSTSHASSIVSIVSCSTVPSTRRQLHTWRVGSGRAAHPEVVVLAQAAPVALEQRLARNMLCQRRAAGSMQHAPSTHAASVETDPRLADERRLN